MSLSKKIQNFVLGLIPSPITVDFEKGGGHFVEEVAPLPKEVFWDDSVPIHKTIDGIEYVQTPKECFNNLPDYDFEENYVEIDGMKMHYVDAGDKNGEVILMLHGQPTWSFLYRKMINQLAPLGYRCIAPDMIGMGKSDKPIQMQYHTYDKHCENQLAFIKKLGLKNITVFIQDWGSVIGMRLVGENPELFSRVVLANGDLPAYTDERNPLYIPNPVVINPKVNGLKKALAKHTTKGVMHSFQAWVLWSLTNMNGFSSEVIDMTTESTLTQAIKDAYDAPFPSFIYNAGPRTLPSMTAGMRGQTLPAIEGLKQFKKPFLSIIGTKDRLLGRRSIQKRWVAAIPGAANQQHEQYHDANHFIQEDIGETLADRLDKFIKEN